MYKIDRTTDELNEAIQNIIKDSFEGKEVKGKYKTIRYTNVKPQHQDQSYQTLAKKINTKDSLTQKYKADVEVINNMTGEVVDKKQGIFLGNVPIYTKKGGFLVDGNSYNLPSQIRLKPGSYTLNKRNGDVETLMNIKNGVGMKIISPSDKNDINIMMKGKQFNPYDTILALGGSEKEMVAAFGPKTVERMKQKSDPAKTALKIGQSLGLITDKTNPPEEEVKKIIDDYFKKTELDPSVTKETLGAPLSSVNKDTILLGVRKNLMVKRGDEPEDDKENLMFKRIITPEKLLGEGIQKELKKTEFKMKGALNNPFKVGVQDVIKEPTLSRASKSFITTSAISRMPEEYNPLQTSQGNNDITPLGEGGITSSEMISSSVRAAHTSQLGVIDPVKSPEGANTGVTLSTTKGAFVDKDGNPALKVRNLKNNKIEVRTVGDLWDKKIAFPDPDKKGVVGIRHKHSIFEDKLGKADFQIVGSDDMYGPAMNALGIISANDPTRNLMASKHVLQALPLKDRDVNPVDLMSQSGESMSTELSRAHIPTAKSSSKVEKIDFEKGLIHLVDKNNKKTTVDYAKDPIQLNTKTYIQHTPIVKPGQTVKAGQHLTDSNFTKGGDLALGKNLRGAWMMYPGTRNDAIIVSEDAAKKLTSVHSTKFDVDAKHGTILNKKKFSTIFPEVAQKIDLNKYDDKGILKPGEMVRKDEPIILGMRKMDPQEARFQNDKVKKLLYGGLTPDVQTWKSENIGMISNVEQKGGIHRILASYESPLKVGDKLSGRSGNKGIVSDIKPNSDMPRDEKDKPIDVVWGGAGVASRQNPAQIIEAALSEVAVNTGKKYTLPHYTTEDLSKFAKKEAEKNGVQLYHKIYDPIRKVHLKNPVFVANYNTIKLFKEGEGGWSAVGHGPVDSLQQPKKGGKVSASAISNMEINSLLAHDAKDFLREIGSVKSQQNKEWFAAFESGQIPPAPEKKAAREKFNGLLNQMNIKVQEDSKMIGLMPMTDKDILKKSSGAVTEPFGLKRNTKGEVAGGYYDTKIFGGHGENFGHIDLGAPVINPLHKKSVSAIMGMTEAQLDNHISSHGVNDVYKRVKASKIQPTIKKLKDEIKKTSDIGKADRAMKSIKALKKIDSLGQTPAETMFISKVPVLPIKMRQPSPLPDGSVIEHDVNEHYKAITTSVNTIKEAKKNKAPQPLINNLHKELQAHVGAMYGTNESPNPKMKQREVKSVMNIISGDNPKTSFWHQKILKNKVFGSGRAVIVPHDKSLGIDEIELPKEVAWRAFEPHVVRKMSGMGIPTFESKKLIEQRDPKAANVLNNVMKEVPVVLNRSPALHKHNMSGHFAKITSGNVMHIPPEIEIGQNADYDGDQMGIHVPFSNKAINDVKNKLMASKQLFSSHKKDNLMINIDLDPFIGFYEATKKGAGSFNKELAGFEERRRKSAIHKQVDIQQLPQTKHRIPGAVHQPTVMPSIPGVGVTGASTQPAHIQAPVMPKPHTKTLSIGQPKKKKSLRSENPILTTNSLAQGNKKKDTGSSWNFLF